MEVSTESVFYNQVLSLTVLHGQDLHTDTFEYGIQPRQEPSTQQIKGVVPENKRVSGSAVRALSM